MSGVNKVILVGHLGADPEIKNAKGLDIANFRIATSKSWKDDSGERQEKTEWHQCVAFKKTAELVGKFLKKGSQVFVEGEIQTRSWGDDSGTKKYRTEIIVNNVQFLDSKKDAVESTDRDATGVQKSAAKKPVKNFAPGAPSDSAGDELGF